jgi:hypothetical protein
MRDNRDELILIDGEYYSHNEIKGLIESNHELAVKCERQTRFIKALKLSNSQITLERNKLCDKCNRQAKELHDIKNMSMFEFGNRYCTSESLEADGHAFARALGVGQ